MKETREGPPRWVAPPLSDALRAPRSARRPVDRGLLSAVREPIAHEVDLAVDVRRRRLAGGAGAAHERTPAPPRQTVPYGLVHEVRRRVGRREDPHLRAVRRDGGRRAPGDGPGAAGVGP